MSESVLLPDEDPRGKKVLGFLRSNQQLFFTMKPNQHHQASHRNLDYIASIRPNLVAGGDDDASSFT